MSKTPTAIRRLALAALCAAAAALGPLPTAARADANPLEGFPFYASSPEEAGHIAPNPGGFEGPCGLAVDSAADFYVADYYHGNIDAFTSSRSFLTQLSKEDPLDGPCGLAAGAAGVLYVNDYHRAVLRFAPSSFPPGSSTTYGAGLAIDPLDPEHPTHPTGVAVDPLTGDVYVDDRTYVAVYEPSGAPLEVGGEPLRIGLGSLQDGYGVAVSAYPATAGYVYVADAATDTVEVYDPAASLETPIAEIDGHETPAAGFVSLRDTALAIDNSNGSGAGTLYLADDLQPSYYERPEAAIYGFAPSGAYAGRFKYNIVDARPPALAVDASNTTSKGRVYVTSGNTEGAVVYAYAPGSLTSVIEPAPGAAALVPGGAGAGFAAAPAAAASAPASAATVGERSASALSPRARQPLRHSGPHRARHRHRRRRAPHGRRR